MIATYLEKGGKTFRVKAQPRSTKNITIIIKLPKIIKNILFWSI
jgi:hypothetical protein